MKNKKIGKYLTLMAVASIGIGTFLDVASGFSLVSAAETATVLEEENKATEVTFDLKNGDTTSFNFWKEDEGGKGLIRNQRYKISVEGNGQIEVYHDNETYETSDLIKVVDGKTMHLLERTFKDGDSVVIKAVANKDFKVVFTPFDEEESSETTETSGENSSSETSTTESNTESSSTKNSGSGTTESSKTDDTASSSDKTTTDSTKETDRFKWVAPANGIYSVRGFPRKFGNFNKTFDLKINGKSIKVKLDGDYWVYEDGKYAKTFTLKKGDTIEASTNISIVDMSNEKYQVGVWVSLKQHKHSAVIKYNPKTTSLEFEGAGNLAGKTDGVPKSMKIEKNQKTVVIDGEKYDLIWDNGTLTNVNSATKDIHYQNNDFKATLDVHSVFDSNSERITDYKVISNAEMDKLTEYPDATKLMQGNLKFEYTDTSYNFSYKNFGTAMMTKKYTYKLPSDFKNTKVFKQEVGKFNYTTVFQKANYGGYMMLVVATRINQDNTMTIVTELVGDKSKGARYFDFDINVELEKEKKVVEPVEKNVPKTGSNILNGAVLGTAGLALSLVLMIRKKFPIK